MAALRTPRRMATSSQQTRSKAGKTYPKSSMRTTTQTLIESSSDDDSNDSQINDDNAAQDESNDDEEEEDEEDDEEEEEDSASEPDEQTLSKSYPFEFDDDETDDEMDIDLMPPTSTVGREFQKSMELADAHAAGGAQDSDNEDYEGVNAVNDEEDEEDPEDEQSEVDVLRDAEADLIAEFEETENRRTPKGAESLASADMDQLEHSRRFSLNDSDDDPFGFLPGVNLNDDPYQGAAFMDDTWGSLWETAEMGIWRKPGADNEIPPANTIRQKRVRFQESTAATTRVASKSSSESSEDEDAEQFPDIFMDQADPKIQQLLAHDLETEWNGLSTAGSDAESVYDFEDDADRLAFELDEDSGSSEADVSSESEDDGDETEDESIEEQQAKMQQFRKAMREAAALNTPQAERTASISSANATPSSSKRLVTPTFSKGPRQGTFICDPTKATLTTDRSTRKTILYPPSQPSAEQKAFWERAKSVVKTSDDSPRPAIAIPTHGRADSPERPFTARATLASMFEGRIDVFEETILAAPIMQPFPKLATSLMSSFTSVADENSDMEAEYPAEFSNILNMEQFQDDSSDMEVATTGGDEPAFLAQGVVGSFRLNQHRAKVESSLASHPAKRNATAEHNALQSGRRAAGNAPITPARKRRSNSNGWTKTGSGVKKSTVSAFSSPLMARRRHSRGQSLSGRLEQTLAPDMWKKL